MIRLAILRHEPETGLGRFADLLDDCAIDYEIVPTTRGTLPHPMAWRGPAARDPGAGASAQLRRGEAR